MNKVKLGQSGIETSPMGMGCWAIGGLITFQGKPTAYGPSDDAAALRALDVALDNGITFFDTADAYGAGHSERLLGQALAGKRDRVVIATKFGVGFNEDTKEIWFDKTITPEFIRAACEASLRRLGTDCIDLYQYHINDADIEVIDGVVETLESLVQEGKIRSYGHSTDFLNLAERFYKSPTCTAMQYNCNLFDPAPEMVAFCEHKGLTGINRGPLAMGLLSGKYTAGSSLGIDDIRGAQSPEWVRFFKDGRPNPELLAQMDAVRELLQTGGRTLAQGALAWLWTHSPVNLPICGIRTEQQAAENAGAMAFGPLPRDVYEAIEATIRSTAR